MNDALTAAYRAAAKRLLLLDYDGTLADLMPTPPEAKPTPHLRAVLSRLAGDPANTVVIVTGRPHETLQEWLGDLPVSFAAEHGFLIRGKSGPWQPSIHADGSWKPEVRAMMEALVREVPGSLLEEKENALAWHCRAVVDRDRAPLEQAGLVERLQPLAKRLGLRIIDGADVVEVQPHGINKGIAARHWLAMGPYGFVLAAGDDTTDEDLLKAIPETGFTIKVRPGDSVAKLRVETPAAMLDLLENLTA